MSDQKKAPATSMIPFTVIVDSREQKPSDLGPLKWEVGTLCTGDYSIKGLTDFIRIERKELSDLIACCGRERARFNREIIRLKGFAHKAVIVEADWSDIYAGKWRGKIIPKQVIHSIARWTLDGVPFVLCGKRPLSCQMLQRMLYLCAKQYYNINKSFIKTKEKV